MMASRPTRMVLEAYLALCLVLLVTTSVNSDHGMSVRDFRGFESIQEVECWGAHLEPEVNILFLKLFEVSNQTVFAYLNVQSRTCLTFAEFSSCFVDPVNSRGSRLRILVSDLEVGESRRYGCTLSTWRSLKDTETFTWSVSVTGKETTTTTAATTTTSTTTSSVSASKNDGRSPIASSVHSELPGFYLPPYVLIIGLVLIVLLALLSLILIILQCRRSGRRRRRNRAANRESLLSTKSEMASCSGPKDLDLGVTTYRATRSFPSFSAAPQPQTVAGVQPGPAAAAFAMRYQKGPPDDTGYVSGSSNHYSEPYGCHDDSTQERVRPVSRTTIPQAKGSPQPPRLPDNHP
ncbi:uncharacterized protein LOC112568586 isoform X18 [Pomacea canaliculata]|uniref:uncharacterized protein LOC112568586 isoform X18 n=1 Tax=Pomacea canaliculata TaxID=400727 RepID=UPI000D73B145|nr:uncharacterized protein LOC112568586 isoform X18 [Pomacea canaliculata]